LGERATWINSSLVKDDCKSVKFLAVDQRSTRFIVAARKNACRFHGCRLR